MAAFLIGITRSAQNAQEFFGNRESIIESFQQTIERAPCHVKQISRIGPSIPLAETPLNPDSGANRHKPEEKFTPDSE